MSIQLRPSRFEKGIMEVVEGDRVVKELAIGFLTEKVRYPASFASVDDLERWLAENEEKLARKKIYRLLSARSYPSSILLSKLKMSGFSDSVCQLVVEEVKSLGYIQDGDYLQSAIEGEFRKGRGPRYIEQKLKSKGLASNQVRQLITVERQREKISEHIRKCKGKDRSKIIRSLQQKGFDFEIILQTIELDSAVF